MAGTVLPDPDAGVFRSAVALLPSYLLVARAGGVRVLRTNRLGAQFIRAAIWGGSNVASFFALSAQGNRVALVPTNIDAAGDEIGPIVENGFDVDAAAIVAIVDIDEHGFARGDRFAPSAR